MDDAPFAIRIEDPRTLVPPEVSPNDAQVVLVNDESCLDDGMNQINGDVATPQVQSVLNEEENLRDKSKEALIHIIWQVLRPMFSRNIAIKHIFLLQSAQEGDIFKGEIGQEDGQGQPEQCFQAPVVHFPGTKYLEDFFSIKNTNKH